MPGLSFFQPAMIALSAAMPRDVRGEVRDVRARRLELPPSRSSRRRRTPSPSCPARASCCANVCASARLLRREEHDVGVARDLRHVRRVVGRRVRGREADRRDAVRLQDASRPRPRDPASTAPGSRRCTTFFTLQRLDHVVRVGRALDVVGRDDAEERRVASLVVALGQRRCGSPTARCAPCRPGSTSCSTRRPRPRSTGRGSPTTLLSATYFCASVCAGAGPCSTGVSPGTSLIFRPHLRRERLDRVLRPASAAPAEEAGAARERRDDRDLERALAADAAASCRGRRGLPCALAATTAVASTAEAGRRPSSCPSLPRCPPCVVCMVETPRRAFVGRAAAWRNGESHTTGRRVSTI